MLISQSWVKKTVIGTGLLVLSGCVTAGVKTADNHPYDGVWSGELALSLGNETCLRRENFILKIQDSKISGKTRDVKYKTSFSGWVDHEGTLASGKINLGTERRNAEMLGLFNQAAASGTWESSYCKGKWKIRKIR